MKKFIFLLSFFILCGSINFSLAKKQEIDPLYLYTEPKDGIAYEAELKQKEAEKAAKKAEKKAKKIEKKKKQKKRPWIHERTFLDEIDMSAQPSTQEDYLKMATDKKRKDFEIPKPVFETSNDIILPNPKFRVIRYNTPPGQRNIDLTKLVSQRRVSSPAILSPDKTKIVYTQASFMPQYKQTMSAAYLIPIKQANDAYEILYNVNAIQQNMTPFLTVGMDEVLDFQFKTLYPIDWSKDSMKIAFKEKIGSNLSETWKTNVIIYDFKTQRHKRLTAVREAIIYWWRQNKQIELNNYMWDIFPVGWDKNAPDRIIVYAYAFTKSKPFFLGTWSIDYEEGKSKLESIDSTNIEIDLNGYGLKQIKLEN